MSPPAMLDFDDNQMFVNAPVAYSVLDMDGVQVAANNKFWELFGYPAGTSLTADLMTHPDSQTETRGYLAEMLSGVIDTVVVEKQYVRADGSPFWGRLTARSLESTGDRPMLLGVIENIDEQRELEAQLRGAAAAQSEFVARVSHELRNPLHTISGMAELLTTSDIDPHALRHAEVVLREARALSSIVSDLLDIGKFDTGNLTIEPAPFAVRSVVDRAARSSQDAASSKGLKLDVSVDDATPIYAIGDAGRLSQIVGNLVGNAIKFTVVGRVALEVRPGVDDMIEFIVTDTGPGIPEDRQLEVFEAFQRLDASAPGAGLGLAISSRLATLMGGSLRLAASSIEGSMFVLAVPLPATDAAPQTQTQRPQQHAAKASRILVVEDNPETQMLASAQLKRLGYEHDIVGDGYQALEITKRVAYGAVLMDWHLPGMDGLETTRRIRQREVREGRDRMPIVSVTARAMAADIAACREAGADDFVAKPASISRIGEVLAQWTGRGDGVLATNDDAAIDQAAFSSLLEELGDVDVVMSLAKTFLAELPKRVGVIVGDASDIESVQLAAHTLKSTSALVGAQALSEIAAQIELSARDNKSVSLTDRQSLQTIADATKSGVHDLIKQLETGS